MGKENSESPILFRGRIGNIIAYIVRGKTYYRRKPEKKYFRGTEKQILQRVQFLSCQKLAQMVMDDINKQLWNKRAKTMTGFDLFKKTNYHSFDTTGTIINYEKLIFSKGPLMIPKNISFTINESSNGTVTATWENKIEDEDAKPSDWLRVIAICEMEALIVGNITAKRSDESATFQLPWENGNTIHLYAYFINEKNKKGSDTFYQLLQLKY
jgi:hypothetical protein